jgi:hypothetical protein
MPSTTLVLVLLAVLVATSMAISLAAWSQTQRLRRAQDLFPCCACGPASAVTLNPACREAPAPPPPADAPQRERIDGMEGEIPWHALLGARGLGAWTATDPARWRRDGEALVGDDVEDGALVTLGDGSWRDYEFSVRLCVERGGNAVVRFRSPDRRHGYLLDCMYGQQVLALRVLGDGAPRQISVVDAHFEHGRSYDLRIALRGQSLTTYLDGRLMNQATDATYDRGGIGLATWQSRVRFEQSRVRFLDGNPWVLPDDDRDAKATDDGGF